MTISTYFEFCTFLIHLKIMTKLVKYHLIPYSVKFLSQKLHTSLKFTVLKNKLLKIYLTKCIRRNHVTVKNIEDVLSFKRYS
jgi:hypothetical protein